MSAQDIRWVLRLRNLENAILPFREGVDLKEGRALSRIEMIKSRNQTSHIYKEEIAQGIIDNTSVYLRFFEGLMTVLKGKLNG